MNLYYNSQDEAVFFTAAIGIIQTTVGAEQRFFGSGNVDNVAKNVSSDLNDHTDDILCLAMSSDRKWALTG